jgi:membrane fusion protein, multidrug efflux system
MKSPSSIAAIFAAVLVGATIGYFFNSDASDGETAPIASRGGFGGATATPVEVIEVQHREIYNSIESLGTLTANESLTINAKVTETVRLLHFDDGALVEEGDILAELTNAEQSAQLAEAQANLDESERQLQRLNDIGSQLASVSAIEQAQAQVSANNARLNAIIARMEDRLIRAPFDGLLGFRMVSPGTLLTSGTPITTLDDIAQLKLDFSVPETLISGVGVGASVVAYSAAFPNRAFEGEVTAIDSRIDPVTRAATIRAIIPNPELILRPGMLMTTEVLTDRIEELVIPEQALIQNAAESYVYVVDENMNAQRRNIQFSRRWHDNIVVDSGLEPGESVVTAGAFKLRPNAKVEIARYASENTEDNSASEPNQTVSTQVSE